MTEAEWRACNHVQTMLACVRGEASLRKLRLFACACCRSVWRLLADLRSQAAVAMSERFADNEATEEQLLDAMEWARSVVSQADLTQVYYAKLSAVMEHGPREEVQWLDALGEYAVKASGFDNPAPLHFDPTAAVREETIQASLVRCLFGYLPFRTVCLEPVWLTATARALSQAIYEERAFDRLPILADVLEEAGCRDADVLVHCRGSGQHARGCWVVDLILGKS